MTNFYNTAYDITPTATGWVNIDVSDKVPENARGLVLLVSAEGGASSYAVAKTALSTTPVADIASGLQAYAFTGLLLGAFSFYRSNTFLKVRLMGYFTDDAVFFDVGVDKSPGATTPGWQVIDCTNDIPYADTDYAIVEIVNGNTTSGSLAFGLRKQGSTDDRKAVGAIHQFALVPLNARKFEFYTNADSVKKDSLYLVGYVRSGVVKANGVDVTPGSTGAYVNVDRSADTDTVNATGVLVEVYNANPVNSSFALRPNGSTDDFYLKSSHAFALVGMDQSKIFQAKIAELNEKLFILGYVYYSLVPPIWTDEGETNVINIYLKNQAQNTNLYLGLFKNLGHPTELWTLASLIEPVGNGYARIALTPADWTESPQSVAVQPAKVFTASGGDWGNVIGYFIATVQTGTAGKLLQVVHFEDGPYEVKNTKTLAVDVGVKVE